MQNMKAYILIIAVLLTVSCVRNKNGQNVQNSVPGAKVFEVSEVLQTNGYSYLKVSENSEERWVATARQEIAEGDVYYYDEALQMTNFHSKELDRTFEVIYFVNKISKTPVIHDHSGHMHGMDHMMGGHQSGKAEPGQKSNVQLEKSKEEVTIAQIFENRDQFSGQQVEIRGVVVKVNKEILGKNWIHIQDGTDSNGSFDLTVTTQAAPQVHDEVTFKGKVILNKDFGSGYSYEVIMEEAELLNSKSGTQL
jgi:hypothetical protein